MNSRSSPESVVIGHLVDQIDLPLWDLWPASSVSAFPSPIPFEALLMPPDDRFRLDDKQCSLPRAKNIGHKAEEAPIKGSQLKFARGASHYCQLLPKKYDLELKLNS